MTKPNKGNNLLRVIDLDLKRNQNAKWLTEIRQVYTAALF